MVQFSLRRRPLLLLPLMSNFLHVSALSQEYCSSENTGSSFDAVSNIYQSNGACEETCVDNYAFAIVQYKQCWCSNYAPANTVDVSECSEACPGYPDESCGDADSGLYGYIALSISPSGTQGSASSSTSSSAAQSSTSSSAASTTTSSTPSSTSSSSPQVSDSTVYSSVSVTVTVKQSASVVISYVTASSTEASPTTSSTTSSTPSSTPSSTESSTSFSSTPITTTMAAAATTSTSDDQSSSSLSHTTFISTRVVTMAGAPVTQTVTSTAVVSNGLTSQGDNEDKGVSKGTVAGAVVGSIIGVALLLAGAFFLWRRRRSETADPESPQPAGGAARRSPKRMERNTSVLSKTGLLSSPLSAADMEKFQDDPTAFAVARGHRYQNSDAAGTSPIGSDGFARRNSRPLVYDQRLNPAALMEHWEENGSRASIGTMQDQRDYSRPLGVTNPDPTHDD